MVNFIPISEGSKIKIAFHHNPKGVIQFIGAFVFGSFPQRPYQFLFEQLYEKGYSIIVYPFPFNPISFQHWPVAIQILIDLYEARVEIIKKLVCDEAPDHQLNFYANDANYYWLGHSLGCKYILLLEILSNRKRDSQQRTKVIKSCLIKRASSNIDESIKEAEDKRKWAESEITGLLNKPCSFHPFIRGQPSLLLAPEINNTVQFFGIRIHPSALWGFPNRKETQCLICGSTTLFKLMGIISFTLDGISRDDVSFLNEQLKSRDSGHLIHESFLGWHFEPHGTYIEYLASSIDSSFQALRVCSNQGENLTL